MSPLRVLAFCDYYDPRAIGGAERVAREIHERLAADHDTAVTVVGGVPGLATPQVVDPWGPVRTHLVRGYDLSGLLGAQMMVAPGLRGAARFERNRERPHVIHVNGLHFHSSQVGVAAARRAGIPLVVTAHLGAVDAMPGRLRAAPVAFDRFAGGRVVRAADRIIAVSRAVADHVTALGADPSLVTVAHNGVDHDRFDASRHQPATTELRVGLIGRLIANKGHDLAIDAVAGARRRGHDVTLRVVGDGPLAGAARARVDSEGLGDAVTFTGQVDDVAEQLRCIDVLVRPSYTEGLPLAVLEALASGVPCVVSDVPGNVEAVRDGVDGIVVPIGDAAALGDALVGLAADRERVAAMATAAAAGSTRFSWDTTARIHHDVLAAAAGTNTDTGAPP